MQHSESQFLDDETFLLRSEPARRLYHEYAAVQPIYDYHSHLSPGLIADDHRFENLYDIWIAGDHYKWRAMRAAGVPEEFCTGSATPYEKFAAFARTVPQALRNPLYHWTHLELRRYFGIKELLNEETADSIWHRASEQLAEMPVSAMLKAQRVSVVCTTDDPTDALVSHQRINSRTGPTCVYPTFRPDKAMAIDKPAVFNQWLQRLESSSGVSCTKFTNFLEALDNRHQFFHSLGGRLSDHGLAVCEADECSDCEASQIFEAARDGRAVPPAELKKFRGYLMLFFGRMDAGRGWTKQLHLGAFRNTSSRALATIGENAGFDSIGDYSQGLPLARYLDRLDQTGQLPKIVLYNINPSDNYMMATMAGTFQDGSTPGKIQFGSGWWFLDQKNGIELQLDALSSTGLLSRFVGMLTDSRSFLSFPRHEYFRRILCNVLGNEVVNGELPNDKKMLGKIVTDICFNNAHQFFGLKLPAAW